MSERLFVKLGGSLITDKSRPYTLQAEILARLCREIAAARARRPIALLLGNGAGSFGHVSASHHRTQEGIRGPEGWRGFAEVHRDAQRLGRAVLAALTDAGETAVLLPPSAACCTRRGRIESYQVEPLERLLAAGVIPLVHGDACLDRERGCAIASTEEVLGHLAGPLAPARLILVGKVDGVLDGAGQVIPRIAREDLGELRQVLRASDGIADVTGGMLHKVERALETGVRTEIINGLEPGRLERVLLGEEVVATVIDGGQHDG